MVWLFVERELRDLRRNAQVWHAYVALGVVGAGIPALFVVLAPVMVHETLSGKDPALAAVLGMLRRLPEFAGLEPAEALTRYLLRTAAGFFLIMPVALSSTSAAFSIVGEKQQRTLEPILATPISDREFLFAKLCAALLPTVATTWITGLLAVGLVDALAWSRFGGPLLPDRFWVLGLGVLAPLLATIVVLVTMRLSARATDAQATVQATALTVIPAFLFVFAVFGKVLTVVFPALLAACGIAALLVWLLFRTNVRRFEREEILTRWK